MAESGVYNWCSFITLVILLSSAAPAPAEDKGYDGLIAPRASNPVDQDKKKPGYSGLIPGYVPDDSKNPLIKQPNTSGTFDAREVARSMDRDGDGTPDTPAAPVPLTVFEALNQPGDRFNGMLPQEYAFSDITDGIMKSVRDKGVPAEKYKENVEGAYKSLSDFASAMRQERDIPYSIYAKLGLPKLYADERRQGAEDALLHLEKALAELEEYRKQLN